jgi:DnaJ-class molecular chaperone
LPPTHEDWWLVLGVARDTAPEIVEKAYRALAMEHHPDKGGDSEVMAKINRAYQVYEAQR